MNQNRLLVVDDEAQICELIRGVAERFGFEVKTACNNNEFTAFYREIDPTVVTLDLQMPDVDGVEYLRFLADERTQASVIFISGSDRKVIDTAKRLGENRGLLISAVVQKPFTLDELASVLEGNLKSGPHVGTLELRQALKGRQLVVHYQPKIDLTKDARWDVRDVEALVRWDVRDVEALVRWNHPVRGMMWPGSFIGLAERAGDIMPLTDYVITTVLTQLNLWRNNDQALSVAINLPAQAMDDLAFPDRLTAFVQERQIDPSWLMLEVTESSAMANVTRAMDVLTRLRLKGFSLSIDDFGTGYSSLSQLHHMPFNELKIDQSFTHDVVGNKDNRTIVKSLVELGKNLGLKVCAEGIEDAETLEIVRSFGCDYGQGYYFSKALPSDELLPLIQSWRESI